MAAGDRRLLRRARGVAVAVPGRAERRQVAAAAVLGGHELVLGRARLPLARRLDHAQGRTRRVRDRLQRRVRLCPCARSLAPVRERADAVHDRRQRGPDHRLRPDHERVVRHPQLVVEDHDHGGALFLPSAREHPPRAHIRAAGVDRADAVVRGVRAGDLPSCAGSDVAAVRLHVAEDRERPGNDRRGRRRLLRREHRGARGADDERRLDRAIRDRMGRDPRRVHHGHRLLCLDCARRAIRVELASVNARNEGVRREGE